MTTTTLTFVEGKSSKFYTAVVDGKVLTIRFGRIGSNGQEKVTNFKTEAEAVKEYESLVSQKKRKGYVEDGASAAPAAVAPRAAAPASGTSAAAPANGAAAKAPPAIAKTAAAPPTRTGPAPLLAPPALDDPPVPGLDLAVYRPGPLPVPERDPTPFPSGDFVIEGYTVSFGDDDEVMVIDAKGKKLKSVPDKLRKHDDYQSLMRGRKDDRARERRARRVLEERMISRTPISAEEIAWLIEDDAFAPLLKGAVVCPEGRLADAGLLVSFDAQKGAGLLPLDYDARWAGPVSVELGHPMTMGDMTAWQDLLLDLGVQQSLVQVFREIKNVPVAQRNLTESTLLANRSTRSAAVVERILMEDGWMARRGMARRKMAVVQGGGGGDALANEVRTVEAWFDYGEYYMPSDGTETGAFGFKVVGTGKALKFSDVPAVLVSEAIRSLDVCLAQAGAKKDSESDEDADGEGGDGEDSDDES